MIRYLIVLALLVLTSGQECFAGYTVAVWQQIQPTYITVSRFGAEQIVLNRGTPPARQLTWSKKICEARDPYSTDPLLRSEVWEDSAGTATSADLFAACPQIRKLKTDEIREAGAARLSAMANPYRSAERETWATQQREARTWLNDHNAAVPMISAMAAERGLNLQEMVDKIMENVALFEAGSGQILGQQQRLLDQIAVETDFEVLEKLTW
jgi:hypothetical protein